MPGKIRPLTLLGNPILRQQAASLAPIGGAEAQEAVSSLLATVEANLDQYPAGLAAPQIGLSCRAFLMTDLEECTRQHEQGVEEPSAFRAILNPSLIGVSVETEQDWESCLSVPGLTGLVERPHAIKVEYYTTEGKRIIEELFDFEARVFQHELDHLDGIIFLDRIHNSEDLMMMSELERQAADTDE